MVIGMKYSIIVCSYNGEKYIDSCLSCLLSQTYSNYEILFIDDGSTDKSSDKLKKYESSSKFILITQENMGLSMARNVGVSKSSGDYLLFVDVDDKVPVHFLETIEKHMEKGLDLIKFNYAYVYEDGREDFSVSCFSDVVVDGEEAFSLLASSKVPFELAPLYAYRKSFFQKNRFSFERGMYHEDYGLIPYVILKSKKVKLLDDVLYYYYQTGNSITRNDDYQKTVKKAEDIFIHSKKNRERVSFLPLKDTSKKLYYSYMANAILLQYGSLHGKEKQSYRNKIKTYHIVDDLLEDTMFRKLKKIMWKIKIR